MTYINRTMTNKALRQMRGFHEGVVDLYKSYGMDLLDNLGRRNIIMSQTQEKFFAQALSEKYEGVVEDGRTGQPDIVIGALDKELECKLTSRHKSGAISFQSDYETLQKKKSLDYLYVVADENFESFGVFLFEGLTTDDFRPLSTGARGKVAMYKHKAMKKCTPIVGSFSSINEINLTKLKARLSKNPAPYKAKEIRKSIDYWERTPTKFSLNLEKLD